MTCTVSPGQSRSGFFTRIRSALVALLRRGEERKATHELLSLNDHLLSDMGLARCEIENAVRLPADYRPACLWPERQKRRNYRQMKQP